MWNLTYSWWEIVIRAVIIYIALFVLFRIVGKKQLGEMAPLDFILLLIISEGVSGGLVGEEYTISGALIIATTLIGLNGLIDYFSFKYKIFEKWIEGEPRILIRDGKILSTVAEKEKVTEAEILQSLREQKVEDLKKVKYGILETSGKISILTYEKEG